MKKLSSLVLVIAVVGCGTDPVTPPGPETLPDLTVPALPENGLQIITPIFEGIQPATDYEVCTWTDQILTESIDVKSTVGYQNEPPGHHVIVFYTTNKLPPNTQRVCTDSDMASFRFLAGSGGEGVKTEAPGDLVFRLPAGAQIVINHHYLNATDEVLRGQSAVNINFAEPGNHIPSGNLAAIDTAINVPPGKSTHDIHCVMERTMKLWDIFPHMHQWGKHINLDVTQAGVKTRLFDQEWEPSFAFHPPDMALDPADPLVLNTGDALDVHCEWDNDTGHDLTFGFEMCVGFGATVDDNNTGSWDCNAGSWGQF
jgi:hypothetical protein